MRHDASRASDNVRPAKMGATSDQAIEMQSPIADLGELQLGRALAPHATLRAGRGAAMASTADVERLRRDGASNRQIALHMTDASIKKKLNAIADGYEGSHGRSKNCSIRGRSSLQAMVMSHRR
jgi:hypothetical protein